MTSRPVIPGSPRRGASEGRGELESAGRRGSDAVELRRHDEIVFVQPFDLLCAQRDRRIAPAEADVRMMAFRLGHRGGAFDKGERLGEILEAVGALDAGRLVEQAPFRRLPMVFLGCRAAQWRNAATARRAAFFGECRGHRDPPSSGTARQLLRRIASLPARPGDRCLIFVTSHGEHGEGLVLAYAEEFLTPAALANVLWGGCANAPTVVIASGCYSGSFAAGPMPTPNRIILTAARADRPSFGCHDARPSTAFDACL